MIQKPGVRNETSSPTKGCQAPIEVGGSSPPSTHFPPLQGPLLASTANKNWNDTKKISMAPAQE